MQYIIPKSVEDIKEKNNSKPAYYIAGATDISVLKKENKIQNKPWIDISQLDELKGISRENGYIEIGALSTMTELSNNVLIKKEATALSDAAAQMGSPLIRNLATIGGNISNSNPAADLLPPLYSLDAILIVQRGSEVKEIPVNEFCLGPCDNVLADGEIITRVKIPILEGSKSGFMKLAPRRALAISKVSLSVWWFKKDDIIVDIKIAMGAVGPRCFRANKTEELLKGQKITSEILEKALERIVYEPCPIDDFRSTKEYRSKMTAVLLKRILKKEGEL